MVHLFQKYDVDGSTLIDRAEFKNMFSELGMEYSTEKVTEIFDLADEDGSGQIDWIEFVRLFIRVKVELFQLRNVPIVLICMLIPKETSSDTCRNWEIIGSVERNSGGNLAWRSRQARFAAEIQIARRTSGNDQLSSILCD